MRKPLKDKYKNELNDKIQKGIEMYLNGVSQNKIAKELNISRNTLSRELKERNIKTDIHINQYVNTEIIQ